MSQRGPFKIVHTETLFLNDEEEGLIDFELGQNKVIVQIVFKLHDTDKSQVHPGISISSASNRFFMEFTGWNATAYSAIRPEILGKIGSVSLRFAVLNTYLDGTNKVDIQFYAK